MGCSIQYFPKEINKQVSIMDVMKDYGLDVALNRNVRCPNMEHTDKRPSARIYLNTNGCKCHGCGEFMRPISIVQQQEGVGFQRACEILIDRYQLGTDCYEVQNFEPYGTQNSSKKCFPLSASDIQLLGLSASRSTIDVSYRMQKERGYYEDEIRPLTIAERDEKPPYSVKEYIHTKKFAHDYHRYPQSYVPTEQMTIRLSDLYENDQTAFEVLIANKAKEQHDFWVNVNDGIQKCVEEEQADIFHLAEQLTITLDDILEQDKKGVRFEESSAEQNILDSLHNIHELKDLLCKNEAKIERLTKFMELYPVREIPEWVEEEETDIELA